MTREFYEEAGLLHREWLLSAISEGEDYTLYCYATDLPNRLWRQVKTLGQSPTDEMVVPCTVSRLPSRVYRDLRWLVPLAIGRLHRRRTHYRLPLRLPRHLREYRHVPETTTDSVEILRAAITAADLSARAFSRTVLDVDERVFRRWLAGDARVPGIARLICLAIAERPVLAHELQDVLERNATTTKEKP